MKRWFKWLFLLLTVLLCIGGGLFLWQSGFFAAAGSQESLRAYIEDFSPYSHLCFFLIQFLSVILAPTLQEEAELPAGNARLKNCESGHLRRQLITPSLSRRYARAYAAHFELWISACLRRQTVLARVPCKGTLTEALSGEALRQGAVELS